MEHIFVPMCITVDLIYSFQYININRREHRWEQGQMPRLRLELDSADQQPKRRASQRGARLSRGVRRPPSRRRAAPRPASAPIVARPSAPVSPSEQAGVSGSLPRTQEEYRQPCRRLPEDPPVARFSRARIRVSWQHSPEPALHRHKFASLGQPCSLHAEHDERARRTSNRGLHGRRRGAPRAGVCGGLSLSDESDATRIQIFQRVEEESKRRALAAAQEEARTVSLLSQIVIPEEPAPYVPGSVPPSPITATAAASARPIVGDRRRGSVSVSRFGQVRPRCSCVVLTFSHLLFSVHCRSQSQAPPATSSVRRPPLSPPP